MYFAYYIITRGRLRAHFIIRLPRYRVTLYHTTTALPRAALTHSAVPRADEIIVRASQPATGNLVTGSSRLPRPSVHVHTHAHTHTRLDRRNMQFCTATRSPGPFRWPGETATAAEVKSGHGVSTAVTYARTRYFIAEPSAYDLLGS